MIEVLMLFLSIKGQINFFQLERYGQFSEQRYRQQYEKTFDFMELNKKLAISNGSGHFVIAFTPKLYQQIRKANPRA